MTPGSRARAIFSSPAWGPSEDVTSAISGIAGVELVDAHGTGRAMRSDDA